MKTTEDYPILKEQSGRLSDANLFYASRYCVGSIVNCYASKKENRFYWKQSLAESYYCHPHMCFYYKSLKVSVLIAPVDGDVIYVDRITKENNCFYARENDMIAAMLPVSLDTLKPLKEGLLLDPHTLQPMDLESINTQKEMTLGKASENKQVDNSIDTNASSVEFVKAAFKCTPEKPLHQQLRDEDDNIVICEISVEGFIGPEDLLWLTYMSYGEFLQRIDLSGVTEMNTGGLNADICDTGLPDRLPFYECDFLEEVVLPHIDTIYAPMFNKCPNLRKVVIPDTLKHIKDAIFTDCPNIEEIYIPSDLDLPTSYHYSMCDEFPCNSFMGSGKRFISDNEGWPDKMESHSFFAFDGVLYHCSAGMDDIELYRYPAGDERTEFVIPDGVTLICNGAFCGNQYLKRVVIPKSVRCFWENPIRDCYALETIIFKQDNQLHSISYPDYNYEEVIDKVFIVRTLDSYPGTPGLKNLPYLKHIYLYAENPVSACFDMFYGLSNIGEVTLYVPHSCKKAYEDYEVEWFGYDGGNKQTEKSYLRFNHIEEFDPSDFIEDEPK
jgi:hypothetical protein